MMMTDWTDGGRRVALRCRMAVDGCVVVQCRVRCFARGCSDNQRGRLSNSIKKILAHRSWMLVCLFPICSCFFSVSSMHYNSKEGAVIGGDVERR